MKYYMQASDLGHWDTTETPDGNVFRLVWVWDVDLEDTSPDSLMLYDKSEQSFMAEGMRLIVWSSDGVWWNITKKIGGKPVRNRSMEGRQNAMEHAIEWLDRRFLVTTNDSYEHDRIVSPVEFDPELVIGVS